MTEEIIINEKSLQAVLKWCDALEQENKELKETIKQYCQWLDEEREDNDKLQKVYQNDHCDLLNYRSALEEIMQMFLHQVAWAGQLTNFEEEIYNKMKEVLK